MKSKKKTSGSAQPKKPIIFKVIFGLTTIALIGSLFKIQKLNGEISNLNSSLSTALNQNTTPNDKYPGFIRLNKEISCENKAVQENSPPCPAGQGNIILPRYYPIHTIFMGYEESISATGLYGSILNRAFSEKPKLKVVVMVPKQKIEQANSEFETYISPQNKDFLELVATPSETTLWAQDYFEIATNKKTGISSFVDLMHNNLHGEHIPTTLALACNKNLIRQSDENYNNLKDPTGNFGGNIESLNENLVAVGNNMSSPQKKILKTELQQKLVEIDVAWLYIGHVDEVISLIPKKNKSSSCPFDIMYTSPDLALSILQKESLNGDSLKIELGAGKGEKSKKFYLKDCFGKNKDKNPLCVSLHKANKKYGEIMNENIKTLKASLITSQPNCKNVNFIPIPVLFSTKNLQEKYGTDNDLAVSITPNPVNNVLINNSIMLPRQGFDFFDRYTKEALNKYDLKVEYVDGEYVHYFKGGVHCSLNLQHSCKGNQI
jgi:hypothetical protein